MPAKIDNNFELLKETANVRTLSFERMNNNAVESVRAWLDANIQTTYQAHVPGMFIAYNDGDELDKYAGWLLDKVGVTDVAPYMQVDICRTYDASSNFIEVGCGLVTSRVLIPLWLAELSKRTVDLITARHDQLPVGMVTASARNRFVPRDIYNTCEESTELCLSYIVDICDACVKDTRFADAFVVYCTLHGSRLSGHVSSYPHRFDEYPPWLASQKDFYRDVVRILKAQLYGEGSTAEASGAK